MREILFVFVLLTICHQTYERNLLRESPTDVLKDQQDTKTVMRTTKTGMEAITVQTKVISYHCSLKIGLWVSRKKEHYLGKKESAKECFRACITKTQHDSPNINRMLYGVIGKLASKNCHCGEGAEGNDPWKTTYTGCDLNETKWDN